MNDSTEIGGAAAAFPSTSWSMVRAAANSEVPERRDRLQSLLAAYWKPVYHCIRRRWRKSNEDAKDLTQGFFVLLLEGSTLERLGSLHGSLRGYLKAALDHYLVDEERRKEALKRGGGCTVVAIDLSSVEHAVSDPQSESPDGGFDREWIAACLSEGVRHLGEELKREGRETHYRIFQRYYLDRQNGDASAPAPTYDEVARELGVAGHDVANSLVYTRRRLRMILKERIADTTASERDAAEELRFVLGD